MPALELGHTTLALRSKIRSERQATGVSRTRPRACPSPWQTCPRIQAPRKPDLREIAWFFLLGSFDFGWAGGFCNCWKAERVLVFAQEVRFGSSNWHVIFLGGGERLGSWAQGASSSWTSPFGVCRRPANRNSGVGFQLTGRMATISANQNR